MDFEELMTRIRGFQESRAILTAVELDVFSAVGDGATAAEIAERTGTNGRSMEMLLNALVSCGLLEKDSGGRFRNTGLAAAHLTGAGRMATMHSVHLWDTWSTLTDAVRKGTCVTPSRVEGRGEDWTEAFIAAMHRGASSRAPSLVQAIGLKGVRRVLDVGGGSGAYAIAIAQASPDVQVDVLDLDRVTLIAKRNIHAAGLADRVRTIVGDLRSDSLGRDYDLVLLSAICHMLDETENRDLLRRCAEACASGGRVVIQDFILDETKTAPQFATLFSLNMLVGTRGGSSYSAGEYEAWLLEAGLQQVQRVRWPGPANLMIGTRP